MKVFISSVITGFHEHRAAAKHAVQLLGFEPIMAEDFPAQPQTPQQACLGGVTTSDVYLAILGPRYGTPASSGRAPTEEEFEEARRLHKPILTFATRNHLEDAQQKFLGRIRSWDEGVLYARFQTPNELKDEIIRALIERVSPRQVISPQAANELLNALYHVMDDTDGDVVICLALVPETEQALIQLSEIDDLASHLSRTVSTLPHFSKGSREIAKERSAEVYVGEYRREACLEVFDDGRMVGVLPIQPQSRGTIDLASSFMIDADQAEAHLTALIGAFAGMLGWLDKRATVSRLYVQGRLRGVRTKLFQTLPKEPRSSMEVPSHNLPDPLSFPSQPLQVTRPQLGRSSELPVMFRGTIERLFRSAIDRR